MANEAVIVDILGQPTGEPIRYKIADSIAVPKGSLMVFSGALARQVKVGDTPGQIFAGIAATEKVANDGSTTLGCWTKGVFDIKCDTALAIGDQVVMSGANACSGAGTKYGLAFGKAIEVGAAVADVNMIAVGVL